MPMGIKSKPNPASTKRMLHWLVLLISIPRGHPQGPLPCANITKLLGHVAASVLCGVWAVGSTSFPEHSSSSSPRPSLSRSLWQLFRKWGFLSQDLRTSLHLAFPELFFSIIFQRSSSRIWCLGTQVSKNILWGLLALQREAGQVEVRVCGVFTNESPAWSGFPLHTMSFLFCFSAPHTDMPPLPSRAQVFF